MATAADRGDLRTPFDVLTTFCAAPQQPQHQQQQHTHASRAAAISACPKAAQLQLLRAASSTVAAARSQHVAAAADHILQHTASCGGGSAEQQLTRLLELLCSATLPSIAETTAAAASVSCPDAATLLSNGSFGTVASAVVPQQSPSGAFDGVVSVEEWAFTATGVACTMTAQAALGEEEADGTRTINQYVLLAHIGSGAQGEVHLAMDMEQNEMRAVKMVKRSNAGSGFKAARRERERLQLEREVAIMKRCRHRNVVALYEVIDDPEQNAMYLVMQYVEHGPLVKLSPTGVADRRVAPGKLIQYARQIVAGLLYLHEHGVVHRDIKPDNILLGANDAVYLADFGMSDVFQPQNRRKSVVPGGAEGSPIENAVDGVVHGTRGTIAFLAPELLETTKSKGADGEAVDVWALGLTLYVLLYGRLPWQEDTQYALIRRIEEAGEIEFPVHHDATLLREATTGSATDAPAQQPSVDRFDGLGVVGEGASCTPAILSELKAVVRGMLIRDPAERSDLHHVHRELRLLERKLEARDEAAATAEVAAIAADTPSALTKRRSRGSFGSSRSSTSPARVLVPHAPAGRGTPNVRMRLPPALKPQGLWTPSEPAPASMTSASPHAPSSGQRPVAELPAESSLCTDDDDDAGGPTLCDADDRTIAPELSEAESTKVLPAVPSVSVSADGDAAASAGLSASVVHTQRDEAVVAGGAVVADDRGDCAVLDEIEQIAATTVADVRPAVAGDSARPAVLPPVVGAEGGVAVAGPTPPEDSAVPTVPSAAVPEDDSVPTAADDCADDCTATTADPAAPIATPAIATSACPAVADDGTWVAVAPVVCAHRMLPAPAGDMGVASAPHRPAPIVAGPSPLCSMLSS